MFPSWRVMNAKQLVVDKYIQLLPYFKFLRISIFILVLVMIHVWLENSIATVLITHLTGDGLKLPKAASIVNVQDGVSAFLLLIVAYVSQQTKVGSFLTVVFTTISYLAGLLLIFIAARRKEEDLSYLFVAALFIALGRSGRDIALKEFLANQCREEWSLDDDKDEEQIEKLREIHWRIASVAGIIVSISVAWTNKGMKWVVLSKMLTIAMGVGFAAFLAGLPFYHRNKSPQPISVASELLFAAIRKRNLKQTTTAASFSASDDYHIYMASLLRWVDKAAIVEPSLSVDEQLRRGRLHTVEQVGEVKKLLSLIPLWMAFLVYGLLQATASVFFYEQVGYMKLGFMNTVPIEIFAVIVSSISFVVSYIYEKRWGYKEAPRYVMLIRIGIGLGIASVCCVVAWRVESYRLEKHVKSDVSISAAWLIPQFVLLGVLHGLVFDGLEEFFYANVLKPFRKYGPSFTQFFPDIGHFVSIALVLNLRSLFGDDLNTSSLSLYYAILSYICFANFTFYCFIATYFVKRREGKAIAEDEEIADDEGIRDQVMVEELQQPEGIRNQVMNMEELRDVEVEENNLDLGNHQVMNMEELRDVEVEENSQDLGNQVMNMEEELQQHVEVEENNQEQLQIVEVEENNQELGDQQVVR